MNNDIWSGIDFLRLVKAMVKWLLHVLVPVLATLLMWCFGSSKQYKSRVLSTKNKKWLPPGPVIGLVWTLLFAILGYLHFLLWERPGHGAVAVEAFLLFALCYPLIVSRNPGILQLWNRVSLVAAFSLALYVVALSPSLFLWVLPLLLWLTYVNLVV